MIRHPEWIVFAVILAVGSLAPRAAHAFDIGPMLDTCPTHDPAYQQIRAEFEIRHNGVVVGEIPCTEPISAMPVAQYTDELIVVQGLRAALYMDLGTTSLPWAPGMRFYDWLKSKHAGVDIVDGAAFSQCCETLARATMGRRASSPRCFRPPRAPGRIFRARGFRARASPWASRRAFATARRS
jgi:hypothetical protein